MIGEEETHRAFRALLEALARPGTWMATPAGDAESAVALLRDAVWEDDRSLVVTDTQSAATAISSAGVGTEEEPELGATVCVLVGDLEASGVSIHGPGIAKPSEIRLPLGRDAIEARRVACSAFPQGLDVVLVDRMGRVLGLPRTTSVEMS